MNTHHLIGGHPLCDDREINPARNGRRLYFKGGSTSSATTSTTSTSIEDHRVANDRGLVLGGGVGMFDASNRSDNSLRVNDSSDRSINTDNKRDMSVRVNDSSDRSNNSVTTTNVTDGGAFGTVTAGVGVVGQSFENLITGATDLFGQASKEDTKRFKAALDASSSSTAAALSASQASTQAALNAGQAGLSQSFGGFGSLLNSAEKLWAGNDKALTTATSAIAGAYQNAASEKAGALDNKTIMILGVAGAAALAFAMRKN